MPSVELMRGVLARRYSQAWVNRKEDREVIPIYHRLMEEKKKPDPKRDGVQLSMELYLEGGAKYDRTR
jgi:hypothetical protein